MCWKCAIPGMPEILATSAVSKSAIAFLLLRDDEQRLAGGVRDRGQVLGAELGRHELRTAGPVALAAVLARGACTDDAARVTDTVASRASAARARVWSVARQP